MAEYDGITIRFVNEADRPPEEDPWCSESDAWLRLEREDTETPSAVGFAEWASAKGYDIYNCSRAWYERYREEYYGQCDDGVLYTINVFKNPADVEYELSASHGTLSKTGSVSNERNYEVSVQNQSSYSLNTQIQEGTVQGRFIEPVLNAAGEQIEAPEVEGDGTELTWSEPVTGILQLVYLEVKDTWTLTCTARDETEQDDGGTSGAYASIVMAIWRCETQILEITPTEAQNKCGNYDTAVTVDDDEEPVYRCYDINIVYDRCTNDKISEEQVEVICDEDTE